MLDTDGAHMDPYLVEQAEQDVRGYVRQQYARQAACVCDEPGEGDCLMHPDSDH
ncbi:hypothetical protein AB0D74_34720 [Streptomyces sp. NPDC048278]|uniref:hypothetical protein n=1 Tax=Streptomyces sp. NPDC048278 TaxID=3155809 RepID=UPI00342DEC12